MMRVAGPTEQRTPPVLIVGIAFLALVLAVLAGAATGPWQRTDRGAAPTDVTQTFTPSEPPTVQAPTSELPEQPAATPGTGLLPSLLLGVAAIVLIVLAILLVKLLMGLARRGDVGAASVQVAATGAEAEAELDAEAIQHGIAQARAALEADLPPSDAVVEAWLALERAAADSGAARSPAQTPTEFTAVVLRRTPGERTAVEALLKLYLRARFSEHALRERDAQQARAALAAIASAWDDARAAR